MMKKTIGLAFITIFLFTACESGQVGTENNPPEIVSIDPGDGATEVPLDKRITVEFSERIPNASVRQDRFQVRFVETDSLEQGTYEVDGTTARFIPRDSLLESNVKYEVTVDSIPDLHGNKMVGQRQWTFTTVDVPPHVESVTPAEGASNVALDTEITVEFSEEIDPGSVTDQNFNVMLAANDSTEAGEVSASGAMATFSPADSLLENDSEYTVSIEGVMDMTGNEMTGTKSWNFTTADTTGTGQ